MASAVVHVSVSDYFGVHGGRMVGVCGVDEAFDSVNWGRCHIVRLEFHSICCIHNPDFSTNQ